MKRSKAEFTVPILLEFLVAKGIINNDELKTMVNRVEKEYLEYEVWFDKMVKEKLDGTK